MLELNSTTVDFYFKSGQVAKSLPDLLLILIDMSDEEFIEHSQKNDFSQWLEQVLHNSSLAQKSKGIQNKRELIQALKTALPGRNPAPKTQPSFAPKPSALVPDFDLESGHTVQVPSAEKQIEAWEKEFFETTEKKLIPREYVKEFVYGTAFGFLTGLVIGGVLYRVK